MGFPAFIIVDDKGSDFFADIKKGARGKGGLKLLG